MTASTAELSGIQTRDAERGVGTLGHLVWWSLDDVEIPQADCKALVASLGLSPSLCPTIEARGGVVKALESLGLRASPQRGREVSGAGEDVRLFYDRISDTEAGVVMVVNERIVDADPATGEPVAFYEERQRITYSRTGKTIACATDYMRPQIEAAFAKYVLTYRSSEVRKVIQNVLDKAKAILVRESGGVYFAPGQSHDLVSKLQAFAGTVKGVSLVPFAVADTADTRKSTRESAAAVIKAELDAAAADLVSLRERKGDGASVRESTLNRRIADFKILREKAFAYRDLVQMETQDIETSLATLTAEVEALF